MEKGKAMLSPQPVAAPKMRYEDKRKSNISIQTRAAQPKKKASVYGNIIAQEYYSSTPAKKSITSRI